MYFQSHIGSVLARRSLRGVSVWNSIRSVHFHVFHQLFHNHMRVPARVLQATTNEHFWISGNEIRQASPAIGYITLFCLFHNLKVDTKKIRSYFFLFLIKRKISEIQRIEKIEKIMIVTSFTLQYTYRPKIRKILNTYNYRNY